MKRRQQSTSAPTQQPQRHEHIPVSLAECGDSLSIRELCGVLGISERTYFSLKAHRIALVPSLSHLPYRFSKAAVQRYLDGRQKSA